MFKDDGTARFGDFGEIIHMGVGPSV
jgi:hypothetical protein